MISKKVFCETIRSYQEAMEYIVSLEDKGIHFDYEAPVLEAIETSIKVLRAAMGESEDEWIDYFVYETEFGTEWDDDSVYIDDEPVAAIKTPEALYDFLCQLYAKEVDEDIE